MKRITPEQVKAAYQKTGLRPVRGEWGSDGDGCAVAALVSAVGGLDIYKFPSDDPYLEYVGRVLGVAPEYAATFISGFDHDDQPEWVQAIAQKRVVPACPEGFTDGRLAAMAIFGGLLDPVEPEKVSA